MVVSLDASRQSCSRTDRVPLGGPRRLWKTLSPGGPASACVSVGEPARGGTLGDKRHGSDSQGAAVWCRQPCLPRGLSGRCGTKGGAHGKHDPDSLDRDSHDHETDERTRCVPRHPVRQLGWRWDLDASLAPRRLDLSLNEFPATAERSAVQRFANHIQQLTGAEWFLEHLRSNGQIVRDRERCAT